MDGRGWARGQGLDRFAFFPPKVYADISHQQNTLICFLFDVNTHTDHAIYAFRVVWHCPDDQPIVPLSFALCLESFDEEKGDSSFSYSPENLAVALVLGNHPDTG